MKFSSFATNHFSLFANVWHLLFLNNSDIERPMRKHWRWLLFCSCNKTLPFLFWWCVLHSTIQCPLCGPNWSAHIISIGQLADRFLSLASHPMIHIVCALVWNVAQAKWSFVSRWFFLVTTRFRTSATVFRRQNHIVGVILVYYLRAEIRRSISKLDDFNLSIPRSMMSVRSYEIVFAE